MVVDIVFDVSESCDENAVEYVRVKFLNLKEKEKQQLSQFLKNSDDNFPEVLLLAIFAKLTEITEEQFLFLPVPSVSEFCYEKVIYAASVAEDSPTLTLEEIQKINDEIEEIRLFEKIEIDRKTPFTIGE